MLDRRLQGDWQLRSQEQSIANNPLSKLSTSEWLFSFFRRLNLVLPELLWNGSGQKIMYKYFHQTFQTLERFNN